MERGFQRLDRFRERRARLIEQLRAGGIDDLAVLHAFDTVPRHLFVPDYFRARAYLDEALLIGHGQTISKPSTHALYLEALNLQGHERVLEIGTGSGFQTALLARLAGQVCSIERHPELAAAARIRIEELGMSNVAFRAGDGSFGWPSLAPFDAVLVTACAPDVPQPLLEQLTARGRLLIPIGTADRQELHVITRSESGETEDRIIAQVNFVAMQGESGQPTIEERVVKR